MSEHSPAIAVTVGCLALYSLAANLVLEGAGQAIAAAGLTAGLLLLVRYEDVSIAELGLARRYRRAGLRWGIAVAAPVAAVIVVASLLPFSSQWFTDDRVATLNAGEVAVEALVRIPVGTALVEELLFRGVLLALLLRRYRDGPAVAWSSGLFGLWHVLPALGFAEANAGLGTGRGADVLAVAVTVIFTGLAGALLAWLRLRSRSLAAPVIVHGAVNAAALVAAWSVTR